MSDIAVSGGSKNPAKDAGIKIGDVITSVDGYPVKSNSEMAAAIEKSTSDTLSVEGIRDGRTFTVTINPATAKSDGRRKIGLWVRDSSAGIGTMTYYDPALQIAAGLGHGICDVDTGEIMPCGSGEIVTANIYDIVKGTSGSPGELRGRFNTYVSLGEIIINDETGVFAYSGKKFSGETMRIAMRQEVQAGYAQIYTTIDGNGPRYYDCEIQNVRYSDESPTKNMVIKITDSELLEKTGGIVQGMSGSPIIQNGLLVGAVTHVFVNDSSCGYAIFAENMESTAEKAQSLSIDAAS
jgi:stage IV sporulation protein B